MQCDFVSSVCYNKISQTGWLKPQTFISHNLEVGNSKIKMLTSLMAPERHFGFFSSSKDTNHNMGALSSYFI